MGSISGALVGHMAPSAAAAHSKTKIIFRPLSRGPHLEMSSEELGAVDDDKGKSEEGFDEEEEEEEEEEIEIMPSQAVAVVLDSDDDEFAVLDMDENEDDVDHHHQVIEGEFHFFFSIR